MRCATSLCPVRAAAAIASCWHATASLILTQLRQRHGHRFAQLDASRSFEQLLRQLHRPSPIAYPIIGSRRQQPGQSLGEFQPIGVESCAFEQTLISLLIPLETNECHGISEARLGDTRVEREKRLIVTKRLFRPSGSAQRIGQGETRLDVIRLGPHSRREPFDRVGVPTARCNDHPQAVMRFREVRRQPQRRLELCYRIVKIPHHEQSRSQPMPQRRCIRSQFNSSTEIGCCHLPLPALESSNPSGDGCRRC